MKTLLIIDGNALMHRAYHALPDFKSKDGKPTNAVYGFASIMHKVRNDIDPTHLLVCFDTREPTFRDEMFEDYRAQRPETDKELVNQFPMVREMLDAAHIPYYEKDGYEADDLIATVARMAEEEDMKIIILTGDKDIFQLVNGNVRVLTPGIGFSKEKLYAREDVIDKFGVPPEKIADYKALVGDPSDNYKGVKGVGPKTAVKLIEKFDTVENLYKNLDQVRSERIRKLLKDAQKHALLSKDLAILKEHVDIDVNLDEADMHAYDDELKAFFDSYQFRSLKKRFFNNTSSDSLDDLNTSSNKPIQDTENEEESKAASQKQQELF